MPTQVEEQQARDFLKRAEIKTMRKDLRALREVDALKEREKIAKIKTLEEQLQEQQTKRQTAAAKAEAEKAAREGILEKHAAQERIAEKDIKSYASEPERQQIFLLESERFNLEKQAEDIDKVKDPELKLQKNNLLLRLRDWQTKLNAILAEEKKMEDEQIFVAQKGQETTVPQERKGLEQTRSELDQKIQAVEKKRWQAEKEIEALNAKIGDIDKTSQNLVEERNGLRDKILGIDKSLREIYSVIIEREEEKKQGQFEEQRKQAETLGKAKEQRFEQIRRQQWPTRGAEPKKNPFDVPVPARQAKLKQKLAESLAKEEEQRKSFLQNVETWSQTGENSSPLPPPPPKKQL